MKTAPSILRTAFYRDHAHLLCSSYRHWTGERLLNAGDPSEDLAGQLYAAPFGIVSHGTEADPIFNFGNAVALELFEMSWEAFTRYRRANQPSRSAVRNGRRCSHAFPARASSMTTAGFASRPAGGVLSSSERASGISSTRWGHTGDRRRSWINGLICRSSGRHLHCPQGPLRPGRCAQAVDLSRLTRPIATTGVPSLATVAFVAAS